MSESESPPKRVFISYSHKDEAWKERLQAQLNVLELENQLGVWEDRQIAAGDDWCPAIEEALNSAQVAVLLISADFLGSKFIRSEEVPRMLERRAKDGLRVIPLMLRPCTWQAVPWLASIQGRPKDNKPLSSLDDNNQEQCLADLALEILTLLKQTPKPGDPGGNGFTNSITPNTPLNNLPYQSPAILIMSQSADRQLVIPA
ncbi:MAG: toll/interleukin-1 receptor domain-containing protein, partial [Candidatus Methylumidiphilus sp.]